MKKKSIAFQSDIVIDENGEIYVSFLGEDLLHLAEASPSLKKVSTHQGWSSSLVKDSNRTDISKYEDCKLCPQECGFNRLKKTHPLCGDYRLRVSNFGISFGDEKLLSNNGGSGVIFLSGCPLTCPSCINKEKVHSQGTEVSTTDFYDLFEKLYEKGASNIQILSPTVHFPALEATLKNLKSSKFPLPIALKTSGHDLPKQIERFKGLVDIYIPDLKPCFSAEWSKKSKINKDYQELFIQSIKEMYKQVGKPKKSEDGSLTKGILIRYVKPDFLPPKESKKTESFLYQFKDKAIISILNNYVNLVS